MFKRMIIISIQLLVLILINQLGYWLVETFHIPLPGNVIGMIILFTLLMTGAIRLSWIEETTNFLNNHLGFFFIPICVGLMTLGPILLKNGLQIIFILMISLVIGLITTGSLTQVLMKRKAGKGYEHHHHSF